MRVRFMGNFTGPIKVIFFNLSIGIPMSKKKSRNEITIITETGKILKRNDTIWDSPSLFSFPFSLLHYPFLSFCATMVFVNGQKFAWYESRGRTTPKRPFETPLTDWFVNQHLSIIVRHASKAIDQHRATMGKKTLPLFTSFVIVQEMQQHLLSTES